MHTIHCRECGWPNQADPYVLDAIVKCERCGNCFKQFPGIPTPDMLPPEDQENENDFA